MKSSVVLALLMAAVLLAPAACGGGASESDEGGTATAGADAAAASTPMSGTLAAEIGEAMASDGEGTPEPTPNATVEKLAETFTLPEDGDADAPLLIMEFSDYRCPYCRQFFDETMPSLRKDWIETGKAKLQFFDLPLTMHGFPAVIGAEAAHCAGEQGAYWAMHDALYEAFDDLTEAADAQDEADSMAEILKVAEDVEGVDMDKLTACVESQQYRPIVKELADTALEREINGTPWFILLAGEHAEQIPGYVDYETMLPLLEREYSRALGTPIPTDTPAPATPTSAVTAETTATIP